MGGPGVPYSPPYVLVPASALQFCALPSPVRDYAPVRDLLLSLDCKGCIRWRRSTCCQLRQAVRCILKLHSFCGCCLRRSSLVSVICTDLYSIGLVKCAGNQPLRCCAVPGYAQQMVPAQGVSASNHGFGPAPFGARISNCRAVFAEVVRSYEEFLAVPRL